MCVLGGGATHAGIEFSTGSQLSTIAHLPELDGCGSEEQFSALVPASAASAGPAPVVINSGHDFALLRWNASVGAHAYRVLRSRWEPVFTVHYAPDLTGVYNLDDAGTVHVCTRRDGTRGAGRMIAYVHAEKGGFGGLATADWDVVQGGYSGTLLYSNASGVSGRSLWYAHRDGALVFASAPFRAEASAYTEAFLSRAANTTAVDGLGICALMPPPERERPRVAPDLSGHYFSTYNESITVCSRNGSLVASFSGVGLLQGFALGTWVPAHERWEGRVLEAAGDQPFYWVAGMDGSLSGEWSVYNRTWVFPESNETAPLAWVARRDETMDRSVALTVADWELSHLCTLLDPAEGVHLATSAGGGGSPAT